MKVILGEAHSNNQDVSPETGREDLEDKLESDFRKGEQPALWAPGYPKAWGQEVWKFSTGHGDNSTPVNAVSATSDEKFLAIATVDTIVIFEVDGYKLASVLKTGGEEVHTVEFAKAARKDGGYVLASSYGQGYAEADRKVRIWHLDQDCKEASTSRKDDKIIVKGDLTTFAPTAFSHDSKTLLYLTNHRDEWGNHRVVVAIDVETGKEKYQMQGHTDSIMWTGFSPDDELIASAAWDGFLKLYSSKEGKLIRDYGPTGGQNWACAFDEEGKNLVVTRGGRPPSAFVWRTDDPRSFPVSLKGTSGWQRVISYSPDGAKLAIGAADGRLVIYETKAMNLIQVWQLAEEKDSYRWVKEVTVIEWLDGGKRICWTPMDGSLHVYDFESNVKWKWGPGKDDSWRPGAWFNTLVVLESNGLIGSKDQDGAFRIWKLP
ncbi:uncharacterized protein PAC_19388 [Phialocephala subalpina]|uniref:Uncharacterized protein n=1 Tax=Phialocephala subalpina TaxID=576137 RepID=A0A1L7XWV5_9HELO|nr:uncharacterized protein PAC_19388 [Phialocephala subalpina]